MEKDRGEGLESGVLVPNIPIARVKNTVTIPKHSREKKKTVEIATETTTTRGRGRKPRMFVEEKDNFFRLDKAFQTTTDGSSSVDHPRVAELPVLRDAWNEGWKPPVPIIHDTVMNRFSTIEAELREETRRQMEEANARFNWEQQFLFPTAIDRQEVELYLRVGRSSWPITQGLA